MMQPHHSQFFKVAYRTFRYFAIASVSFIFTIILSQILGGHDFAEVLVTQLGPIFMRSSGVVVFVMAAAIIFESCR